MRRLLNNKIYIIIIAIFLCIGITFLARSCAEKRSIEANITPLELEIGNSINFTDSTAGSQKWLWEFGDGQSIDEQSGQYTFTKVGKYQVRLTVDGSYERLFIVNVREKLLHDNDQVVQINGPSEGMQGEYIVFNGVGSSKEWRWRFGETGLIDSRDKSAIYKYNTPGTYQIELTTEDTKYPVRHTIIIDPIYMANDTTDVSTIVGNDIKEKLQNIVDQKNFNTNYNYILSQYLDNNPNTVVVINNIKRNDFYSYCQGLRLVGKNKTNISNVVVNMKDKGGKDPTAIGNTSVTKITVIQLDDVN